VSKYYEDTYNLAEYDALLYTNKKSKKKGWSVRIKLRGRSGYLVKSCKTDKLHIAIEFAKKLALRTHDISSAGLDPSRSHRFQDVFEQFLKHHRNHGTLSRHRLDSLTGDYERYFSEYFGSYDVQDITSPIWENFKIWRRSYWKDQSRVDALASQQAGVVKAQPKNATLRICRNNFVQFVKWCYRTGYISREPAITAFKKNPDEVKSRGAPFERHEWAKLASALRQDAFEDDSPNLQSTHLHQRRVIYYSSLFMVGTMMRPSEVFRLKWEDIGWKANRFNVEDEDLVIEVPASVSKTKKHRTAIGTCSVAAHMRSWKEISGWSKRSDYIFPKWGGERLQTINKSFVKKCEELGILYSSRGIKRTVYSCRHTGITFALGREISEIDVALLAGTSLTYIQNNYYSKNVKHRSSDFATQYSPRNQFDV
jgi:integrase